MKLFKVELSRATEIVVCANSYEDARREAYNSNCDFDDPYIDDCLEILDASQIPQDWKYDIPYGDNEDELTCEQILEKIEEEREVERKRQLKMHPSGVKFMFKEDEEEYQDGQGR